MKDSLLVYSGGMDSSVLLYLEKERIGLAVSFDYGSKHNDREYEYAVKNTTRLGISHVRISLKEMFAEHFKSDLLKTGGDIPEGHYAHESMKRTVVPFRNGIMLAIATGIAESNGLERLLIANHFGDHAIYPDCRATFIQAMREAMNYGTESGIVLSAPFTQMTKRDIALTGKDIGVPFELTYSCYNGREHHCKKCGTCNERVEALAGFDPTIYE